MAEILRRRILFHNFIKGIVTDDLDSLLRR